MTPRTRPPAPPEYVDGTLIGAEARVYFEALIRTIHEDEPSRAGPAIVEHASACLRASAVAIDGVWYPMTVWAVPRTGLSVRLRDWTPNDLNGQSD